MSRWHGWATNNATLMHYRLQEANTTKENRMRTYEEALEHYEACKAPTRSPKWLAMPDNPHYLRNVSADHMGIHKEESTGAIYYRLYDTNVAKIYPRDAEGVYKVETHYYASQTTQIFMYENSLHYYTLQTTEGTQVQVPYVGSGNGVPSATLYLDSTNRLILSKSQHRDIFTMKSSADDKDKRKEFKKKVDVLMTLAMFRLPEYRANVELKSELGEPFALSYRNKPVEIDHFEDVAKSVGADNTDDPRYIEAFLDLGQAVFSILASNRAYNAETEDYNWKGGLFRTWGMTPDQLAENHKRAKEIAEEVTAEDFKKSLMSRLLAVAQLKTGSVKTPWGQFKDTIPRTFYT